MTGTFEAVTYPCVKLGPLAFVSHPVLLKVSPSDLPRGKGRCALHAPSWSKLLSCHHLIVLSSPSPLSNNIIHAGLLTGIVEGTLLYVRFILDIGVGFSSISLIGMVNVASMFSAPEAWIMVTFYNILWIFV